MTNNTDPILFGTMLFWDAMTKPQHLDSGSVDWRYPIQTNPRAFKLSDTRSVRNCYRSKRIDITSLSGTGVVNASVFVQNTDYLIPGAVRLYLWRASESAANDLAAPLYGDGWNSSVNGSVTEYTFVGSSAPGGVVLLGRMVDAPVPGTTYTVVWTITGLTSGSITIEYGGEFISVSSGGVEDPAHPGSGIAVSTTNITESGMADVVASVNDRLRIQPTGDFNGTITVNVVPVFGIQPLRVGSEDFLELVCNTRSVTKGMAVGSASVDAVFSYMQVVVMQPCSGVSIYVGPAAIDRGPTVGPAIAQTVYGTGWVPRDPNALFVELDFSDVNNSGYIPVIAGRF